ncbi:hypothetical protein Ciccas_000610 [Cichlidogyrus casuarinus]|uniref:Uncharacterized protein n=1 Tax=Cichlidogyrus casuarinus TaxID=1844966 RepID=A0ABD2QME9_9PLAT
MSADSFEMMLDMTSKDLREFTWNCIKALAVVGLSGCLYITGKIIVTVVSCSVRLGTIIYKIATKKKPNRQIWAILVGHQSPTAQAFMNYTNYLGYNTAHFALDASLDNHMKSNKLLCDKSFESNQIDQFISFLNENDVEYCCENAGNFINIWHEIDSLRGPTMFNCQQAYLHQLNDCLHAQFMSSDNVFVLGLELPSPYNNYALQLLKRIAAMHFTWLNLRFSIGLYLAESIFYVFAIDPLPKFKCLQPFSTRGNSSLSGGTVWNFEEAH